METSGFMPWGAPIWEDLRGRKFALNPALLNQQKIDKPTYNRLIETHRMKFDVIDIMASLDPVIERGHLKTAAGLIDEIEYLQQEIWGLPLNPDFHMFWIVPHCTCPKDENEHLWGYPVHVIAPDCPVHTSDKIMSCEDSHGWTSNRRRISIG